MSDSQNSKRIAINTLMLYFRLVFTMAVSLYTSRVFLNVLGETDFGIYNVVGGVVAMFGMISGSFTGAITRFLTFEMGKNNYDKLKQIFSTSVSIQIIMSIIVLIAGEIIGQWFIYNKMTIMPERIDAAIIVLHCSLISFAVNLLSIPYNAAIVAHEDMKAFAYFGILEVILKLVAVYLLTVLMYDKLVIYAVLLLGISVLVRVLYSIYCRRYDECSFSLDINRGLIKEMGAFVGWNTLGVSADILRSQGVNVLINVYFSPAVNAARGISFQVNNVITQFSLNFMKAVNPQITKSYSSGNKEYMMSLVYKSAKFSFYLLMLLTLALLVKTPYVMRLWLNVVPNHTVNFVQLMILFNLAQSFVLPLSTLMLATGKIRNYQIIVSGIVLMILPISWILLYFGGEPESTVIVYIVISLISLFARLIMLRDMVDLKINTFLLQVVLRCVLCFVISYFSLNFISKCIPNTFWGFVLVLVLSLIIASVTIFCIGLERAERLFLKGKIFALLDLKNKC